MMKLIIILFCLSLLSCASNHYVEMPDNYCSVDVPVYVLSDEMHSLSKQTLVAIHKHNDYWKIKCVENK